MPAVDPNLSPMLHMMLSMDERLQHLVITKKLNELGYKGYKKLDIQIERDYACPEEISDDLQRQINARVDELVEEFSASLDAVMREMLGDQVKNGRELHPALDASPIDDAFVASVMQAELDEQLAKPPCDDPDCIPCQMRRQLMDAKAEAKRNMN